MLIERLKYSPIISFVYFIKKILFYSMEVSIFIGPGIFVIFGLIFAFSDSRFLNGNETAIIIGLMRKLHVKHCIFLQSEKEDLIFEVKEFSFERLSIMSMDPDKLFSYLDDTWERINTFYTSTGIVFKEKYNFTVNDLLKIVVDLDVSAF